MAALLWRPFDTWAQPRAEDPLNPKGEESSLVKSADRYQKVQEPNGPLFGSDRSAWHYSWVMGAVDVPMTGHR
jgi:hypothetical protein